MYLTPQRQMCLLLEFLENFSRKDISFVLSYICLKFTFTKCLQIVKKEMERGKLTLWRQVVTC